MKIIIDTNVVISGVFFGGQPRRILEAVAEGKIKAAASMEIIKEYERVFDVMVKRKNGHIKSDMLYPFISKLQLIDPHISFQICRDKDDDKFLNCAVEAAADYIISGDDDLLALDDIFYIPIISSRTFLSILDQGQPL